MLVVDLGSFNFRNNFLQLRFEKPVEEFFFFFCQIWALSLYFDPKIFES